MANTNFITDLPFEDVTTAHWQQETKPVKSTRRPFMEANTQELSLPEIRDHHIIPVFSKDNETAISHVDFIEAAADAVYQVFRGETVLEPNIRVSHPIKGRIPEAKHKSASELLDRERTIYYERMAFVIEIPSISDTVDGNRLNLTVGGVKAYNLDNLHQRKGADEHFKIFAGFQNMVCTNLIVRSDGYVGDLKVKSTNELNIALRTMLESCDFFYHSSKMDALTKYSLTEQQFAQLIGRCRMYNHLSGKQREGIPELLFGDQQLGAVVRDYYKDESFCRNEDGSISLWKLHNLFTEANKSSYIDSFLDRAVNATSLVEQLRQGLDGHSSSWYLQ